MTAKLECIINLICGSCEHLGFHCTVVQVLIMYLDHELTVSQWTLRNLLCRSWLFAWTRSSRQAVSWWTSNSRTPPCPTTSSSTTSPGYTGIWNAKLFKSEKNLICSPWKDIYPKHAVVFNSFNTQIAAFVSDNIEFRWHKMLLLPGRTLSSRSRSETKLLYIDNNEEGLVIYEPTLLWAIFCCRDEDFELVLHGITRLLMNPLNQTYLPYSQRKVNQTYLPYSQQRVNQTYLPAKK